MTTPPLPTTPATPVRDDHPDDVMPDDHPEGPQDPHPSADHLDDDDDNGTA